MIKLHLWNKIKQLYDSGALHITLGTFATKFVAFFGSIFVVRLLSKSEYGLLSYVENIYSYAFIFAGFGLSNGILRYLVVAENTTEKMSYYNYIIKRSIFIDTIIVVGLILYSLVVAIPENYSDAKNLIPIIAILLPFQDLLNEELYTIRAFFKNKLYACLAFLSSTFLIIGRIIGAYFGNVKGVIWSRVIINGAFSLLLVLLVFKFFFTSVQSSRLDHKKRKIVNIYSFQYMITNGFWAVFMLNDAFLLGLMLNDPSSLADYKIAYVLPGNISIFATAVGVFVGPYFTKNETNLYWVRRNFKKVFVVSFCIVGSVAIVISILARPLIQLLYGEQYLNVVYLMRTLLLAAFLNSGVRYTVANLLAAMGEIKYNMIVSGAGIVVQVILDIILIPKMGVIAVAYSNCFVFFLMSAFLLFVFYKKYFLQNNKMN